MVLLDIFLQLCHVLQKGSIRLAFLNIHQCYLCFLIFFFSNATFDIRSCPALNWCNKKFIRISCLWIASMRPSKRHFTNLIFPAHSINWTYTQIPPIDLKPLIPFDLCIIVQFADVLTRKLSHTEGALWSLISVSVNLLILQSNISTKDQMFYIFYWTPDVSRAASYEITFIGLSVSLSVTKFSQDYIISFFWYFTWW